MKSVRYEEEGVATAVGAIFAILIFMFLLSLFITSYVPAEMKSYEEQYSSGIQNDMVQLISTLSQLSVNYQQGASSSVAFNLQSNYIPLFSSPTVGELSLSSSNGESSGYLSVSNSTEKISSGGVLTVVTNNRYFVDEAYSYEFSTIFYEQLGSNPLINTTLESSLIHVNPPANGSINLSMNLFNLVGGPFNISTQSPFSIGITALSKNSVFITGNLTIACSSISGNWLYTVLEQELLSIHNLYLSYATGAAGYSYISIYSNSIPVTLHITEVSAMVSVNG
ncbi:MAG: hypothetical protein ACP5NO_03165 [Thermoplasmata archaeon]